MTSGQPLQSDLEHTAMKMSKVAETIAGLLSVLKFNSFQTAGQDSAALYSSLSLQLDSAHATLWKCAEALKGLNPICRLPQDILISIFTAARDAANDDLTKSIVRPPLPLVISHVCPAWRRIAISHPLLWTSLNFDPPWNYPIIDLFLRRSQDCLIDLHLAAFPTAGISIKNLSPMSVRKGSGREDGANADGDIPLNEGSDEDTSRGGDDDDDDPFYQELDGLPALLKAHLERCRHIFVKLHMPEPISPNKPVLNALLRSFTRLGKTFQRSSNSLPFLRSLSLAFGLDTPLGQDPETIFAAGTPALVEAKLGAFFIPPSYDRLTKLHIDVWFFTPTKFHTLLSSCHVLEVLAVHGVFCRDHFKPTVALADMQVHLPSLTTLHLFKTAIREFLIYIHAPQLSELLIRFPFWTDSLAGVDWTRLRSVRRLILWLDITSQAVARDLLSVSNFPAVEEVTLVGRMASEALRRLDARVDREKSYLWPELDEARGVLWPRLHTLSTRQFISDDMVLSRKAAGSPLRRLLLGVSRQAIKDFERRPVREHMEHMQVIHLDVYAQVCRGSLYTEDEHEERCMRL